MRTYTRKRPQVQQIQDVQSLCRLCLGKSEEMTSIYGANVDDVYSGLALRIVMCLGLEVSRDDALPKFICKICNSELDKFYTFKNNCATVYRKLKANLLAVKKIDTKKGGDEFNDKEISSMCILNNSGISNENETINSSQVSLQDEISINLPLNKYPMKEENHTEENIILNMKEKNRAMVTELLREREECCVTSVFGERAELTGANTQTADIKIEQAFVGDCQLVEVNHILNDAQAHKDKKIENSDNVNISESLSAYIVNNLIEKGVIAKRNDALEILDQNIKTLHLETACGSEIVMELVEEEAEVTMDGGSKSSHPKTIDPNWKSDARCCGTCGVRFSSRGALVRHLRVHSGEKPFPCRTCGRRFAQREVLRRHELLHSDKLPYQCASCPKAYTQRGALEAHARSHAPPEARSIVLHRCCRCPKVFLYPSGLSRHMSVHQGRDFPCDECSRTFNDKSSLQRHRRAHQRSRTS